LNPVDPELDLPTPPALADPVGPLDHPLGEALDLAADRPFAVAGRRACVTGGAARGVDHVRVHPHRLALGPRAVGARCEAALLTPLGLERRLRVDGGTVVERVVVPRDAPFALFEWQAGDDAGTGDPAVVLDLELILEPGPGDAAPVRWRRGPRSLVAAGTGGTGRIALVFSEEPESLAAEALDGGARCQVRARVAVRPVCGLRLAMAGAAGGAMLERALLAAGRARAVVQARRGSVARLLDERLTVQTPDPALDRAVSLAQVALEARLVTTPEGGRTLVAGYGPDGPAFDPVAALHGARDALLAGDFEAAGHVLRSLGRNAEGSSGPYLALAAEYLAWTGDIATLGTEWPRVLAALAQAGEEVGPAVMGGLAHIAEALGDHSAVAGMRKEQGTGSAPVVGRDHEAADPALSAVRALLGVEPDAWRGRLTLRPRPPLDWDQFQVQGLAMGDAAFALDYRRGGHVHRLAIRQDRGAVPATLVLDAWIPGPLHAARVDGATADLAATREAGGWRVPVQLALDHERVVELEVGAANAP
jgi:hypothetical protein